jgi:hypothetical protein
VQLRAMRELKEVDVEVEAIRRILGPADEARAPRGELLQGGTVFK